MASITTLVNFDTTHGAAPVAGLIADANGDLFGTTQPAARTATARCSRSRRPPRGYASTPTTLVSFNGANGAFPQAGLIADATATCSARRKPAGRTTRGTVFEIAKTAHRLRQHPDHPGQLQRHQRRGTRQPA